MHLSKSLPANQYRKGRFAIERDAPPESVDADLDDLSSYDYDLPEELIAQEPSHRRAAARMLVVHRQTGELHHSRVEYLPEYLQAGDAVVVNDSQVLPARLVGIRTETGGRWEGLYLRHDESTGVAEMLSKTRGRLRPGETITLRDRDGRSHRQLAFVANQDGRSLYRLAEEDTWPAILQEAGRVPLPPYIRDGSMVPEDTQRYQTVYARHPGSVAAPTAGLHLTEELIHQIRTAGSAFMAVTLHVGVGTFRPIESERISAHRMHAETVEVSEPVARRLQHTKAAGGRVVAIGTTTVRTLESAAAAGGGQINAWRGDSELFIRPGYQFAVVDALLTNFHLPKSSLMVLVSAFAGHELIMRAYREAISQEYRFYSYGDCMLIL